MFIRTKKVKKKNKTYEYAHLVVGVWKKEQINNTKEKRHLAPYKNARHVYCTFLGPVVRITTVFPLEFETFFDGCFEEFVHLKTPSQIYTALLNYVLCSHGFKPYSTFVFVHDSLFVDLNKQTVQKEGKKIVLKIQNVGGYICALTLNQLFTLTRIATKQEGLALLKILKRMGISLTSKQFFVLVDKLLKE